MGKIVVVGSGIAGLTVALGCSQQGRDVTVITKSDLKHSSTNWAQGGIAAILNPDDDKAIQDHVEDTIQSGCGHNDRTLVEMVIREAADAVQYLIEGGAQFDTNQHGEFDLSLEGGHMQRRILHHQDRTGAEIERSLSERIEMSEVEVMENTMVIDLILEEKTSHLRNVCGVWALDPHGQVKAMDADSVILATGGLGQVFERTTNPTVSTGDGIALALRAGAATRDLEFIQFHPTVLHLPGERPFLLTEAMRGQGASILSERDLVAWGSKGDPESYSFLKRHDERGRLATRDIIARAIDLELTKTGDEQVWLITSHLDQRDLQRQFPTAASHLAKHGLHLGDNPIPITPAAHYSVGGIDVNQDGGVWQAETLNSFTSTRGNRVIGGLYAIGEVACSGFHGANRLASNSLLEAVVLARRLVRLLSKKSRRKKKNRRLPFWRSDDLKHLTAHGPLIHDRLALGRTMTRDVGVVRTIQRLERAERRLLHINDEIMRHWHTSKPTKELVELRNLALISTKIAHAAANRKQNIGLHYNLDHVQN